MPDIVILLADDELTWQSVMSEPLKEKGYTVQVASSYAEASEKLSAESVDLVIADLKLGDEPGNRDGIELLADAFQKGIPAIVVTGYGTRDMIRKADHYDATKFMHKSRFDLKEFERAVDTITQVVARESRLPTTKETENFRELLKRLAAGEPI